MSAAPATEAAAPDPTEPESVWFVQAAGRVWGPYRPDRLKAFVEEGRITPASLIGSAREGPFRPAGQQAAPVSALPPPAKPAANPPPKARARRAKPKALSREPPAAADRSPAIAKPAAAASRSLVVWADLASLGPARFEALLAEQGAFAGIRPGVWLLRTQADAAALRNCLSRRLSGDDALLVIDAPFDHAAWFNLDGAAEDNLRRLWSVGDAAKPAPTG